MPYKLKKHSGASKRFKRSSSGIKTRSSGRNHILSKQSTKRKRQNRKSNSLAGDSLNVVKKLI